MHLKFCEIILTLTTGILSNIFYSVLFCLDFLNDDCSSLNYLHFIHGLDMPFETLLKEREGSMLA